MKFFIVLGAQADGLVSILWLHFVSVLSKKFLYSTGFAFVANYNHSLAREKILYHY